MDHSDREIIAMGDGDNQPDDQNETKPSAENLSPRRRELIKKLGKAAILPMVVGTFMANDVTDAAAY